MTLWRRMAPTIVWVSLVGSLLATIATVFTTGRFARERTVKHLQSVGSMLASKDFAARCASTPSGWTQALPGGELVTLYDLAQLPAPPAGPSPELRDRILSGEGRAARFMLFEDFAGVTLMRLSEGGPCSLLEIRWTEPLTSRASLLLMAALLAALTALITGTLSTVLVLRPLIRRIQRLASAAARVGGETGFERGTDPATDELGAVSLSLDDADARIGATTRQLIAQNRALQVHLADIAHDLKTPLTAVQLALEEAARRAVDEDSKSHLASSLEDCVYLAAMIDNLRVGVELREGQGAAGDGARTELGAVVEHVVRRLGLLGRFKDVELNMARPEGELWCACRPLVLERVVDNLVYNAVSHGRPGDHVAVLLEAVGDRFMLTVLDDGPGMHPEELAELGRRWFRGEGADLRAPRGSGLGIGIVHEVCRRAGWELCFESNQPQGLKVTVRGALVKQARAQAS